MKKFIIEGITVYSDIENFTDTDAKKYIDYVLTHAPPEQLLTNPLEKVEVYQSDDGKAKIEYWLQGEPFERIRRITG